MDNPLCALGEAEEDSGEGCCEEGGLAMAKCNGNGNGLLYYSLDLVLVLVLDSSTFLHCMECLAFSTILIKRQELQMCFQASKDVGDPAGIFMGEREYPDSFYPRPFSFSWGNMSVGIFILVKAIFSKSVAGLIIF